MDKTFKFTPQLFPATFGNGLLEYAAPDPHFTSTRYYDRRTGSLMWPVFHRECGEVAFMMIKDPRLVDNICAHHVRGRNGEQPEPNTDMVCGSCNEGIHPLDLLAEPPPRKKLILIPGGVN